MKICNILVTDDEVYSRQVVVGILKEHVLPEYEKYMGTEFRICEADSVKSAIDLVPRLRPDISFLDINLEDGSGFDVISSVKPYPGFVVFVTAYERYILDALRAHIFDYIMKPVMISEIRKCVDKIMDEIRCQKTPAYDVNSLLETISRYAVVPRQFTVSTSRGMRVFFEDEIIQIESSGNFTILRLEDNTSHITYKSLKEMEQLLTPGKFFRVHHSSIINMMHVREISREDSGYVFMTGDIKVEVSRRRKKEFLALFENL